MELEDYKMAIGQRPAEQFSQKAIPELENYMRRQTHSVVDIIKKNLELEIAFACLFLVFDCYVFVFSSHLQLFTFLILIICLVFIYYLAKLLKYIRAQHLLVSSVKDQLLRYINIISRFTRLYFQLTMIMIPLVFLLALVSGYLDQSSPPDVNVSFTSQELWLYIGVSAIWSFAMYFFTRWYIKKLYGNHLKKLKEQLHELQDQE